jgi:hypothetical protein
LVIFNVYLDNLVLPDERVVATGTGGPLDRRRNNYREWFWFWWLTGQRDRDVDRNGIVWRFILEWKHGRVA